MTLFLKNNFADYQFINSYYLRKSVGDLCGKLSSPLLDIGCGSRPYDSFFAGIKKVNCDVVQTRGDVDVLCAAYPLPFGNNTFSSVLCTEVLEHVSNPKQGISGNCEGAFFEGPGLDFRTLGRIQWVCRFTANSSRRSLCVFWADGCFALGPIFSIPDTTRPLEQAGP
ncbi:MAG: hypothetical protein EB023_12830 [Flavobacteriia bacterium]|nr:hypothetical protein [Flavobacteriia bacterium]